MACHDIKAKKVGPSYTDIAKKYKGRGGAVDYLTEKPSRVVRVFGVVFLPEVEAKQIVQWILYL